MSSRIDNMWLVDKEADGLLDEATKIHCICALNFNSDVMLNFVDSSVQFLTQQYSIVKDWKDFCMSEKTTTLVFHNGIGYDLPLGAKLIPGFSFEISPEPLRTPSTIMGKKIEIIDTLIDSKWLNPDRKLPAGCPDSIFNPVTKRKDKIGPHGLMAWSYRVSGDKPIIHDWRNQPLEVYVNRCQEDCKTTKGVLIQTTEEMKVWLETRTRTINKKWSCI